MNEFVLIPFIYGREKGTDHGSFLFEEVEFLEDFGPVKNGDKFFSAHFNVMKGRLKLFNDGKQIYNLKVRCEVRDHN